MARHAQTRSRRLLVAIVASTTMLLVAPSVAWAGSAHHGDSRHGHRGKHASAASHHHASHKGHRGHDYRHAQRNRHHGQRGLHRGHGYRHGYRQHNDRYYCKPCGHYFGARDALYGHVAGHHGVPFWQLSYAVANHAFGLIFYG